MRGAYSGRFLAITAAGYGLTLGLVALAVWLATMPILEDVKTRGLQTGAEKTAAALHHLLDEARGDVKHLALLPDLEPILDGDLSAAGRIPAEIARLDATRLASVAILDRDGTLVYSHASGTHTSSFGLTDGRFQMPRAHRSAMVDMPVLYRPAIYGGDNDAAFLIRLPIVIDNRVRGLIAVEKHIPVKDLLASDGFSDGARLVTAFQAMMEPRWHGDRPGRISIPVTGTDFHVAVTADPEATAALGKQAAGKALAISLGTVLIPFLVTAIAGYLSIIRPQRALEESQRELSKNQLDLKEMAEISMIVDASIAITDPQQRILWVNPGFERIMGFSKEEVIGKRHSELMHGPDTDADTRRKLREAIRNAEPVSAEICNYAKDGTPVWKSISISPVRGPDGDLIRFVAVANDITERKAHEAELVRAHAATEKAALTDSVTGLPNRKALRRLMAQVEKDGEPRTLIRLDLDNFSNINQTLGHGAGDHVLRHVAGILRAGTGLEDYIARVSSDEFVVLMRPGAGSGEAFALAARLLAGIVRDIPYGGQTCRVGACFGISSAADGLVGNDDLKVTSDFALAASRETGRNAITLYTPELHREVGERRAIARDMERAIANEEFVPYFQLQVDADDHHLLGVETLVRWQHPTRGIVEPAVFLPVAERLSMVPEIDKIVYRKGLETVSRLNAGGMVVPKISFNVGIAQLMDSDLPELAARIDTGGARVSLEILESVLVEDQSADFLDHVLRLRKRGFGIELDDFGSGHASVVGLMRLWPDSMKLDQRLIYPLGTCLQSLNVVRSLLDIGKALGIPVTAEGVETADHAQILRNLGCRTLQGFHFSHPLDEPALAGVLGNMAAHLNDLRRPSLFS